MTTHINMYIDSDIPLENQIVFLRQSAINFQFNTFEVLKEKLGMEGIEIFKTILRKNYRQAIDKHKGKNFEEIKKLAGLPDKIFGLQLKHDYTKPDEFQYTITHCPFLEESKRRGLGMDFCDIMEEVETEEVSKNLGEIAEPTRMCRGDSKCIIRMKNTLGR